MGQIKGNPAADRSVQNQAYSNLYTGGTSQSGADRRENGTKPVMIDADTTLNEVVDLTFDTDAAAALVSGSINVTINTVSSSINTTITAVSSSINTTITAVSSSINDRLNAVSQSLSSSINIPGSYANDTAAATAGVSIGGLYHTTGTVKVRLT